MPLKLFNRLTTIVLTILFAGMAFAQKPAYRRHFTEGNFLLLEENYLKALSEFKKAYLVDSLNANINYKMGLCYLKHPTEKHFAEVYLETAVTDVKKNYDEEAPEIKTAPPIAFFYLGQAYHLDYKFDEAIKMFDTYLTYLSGKRLKQETERVEHYKQMCAYGRERFGTPANVLITNLGDSVNSSNEEASPLLSVDERMMIFTYSGPLSIGASANIKTISDRYFEDIFVCYKYPDGSWSKPDTLPGDVNTTRNEAAVGLSADGQTLLIYKDDAGGGDLYYSMWNGTEWEMPLRFGTQINTPAWEPSACLSPDGNELYFVSDRPGGYGGRDIYRCKKLPDGQWSVAMNLGPGINTKYDEESPYLHPNGIDFYFSSEGHSSMGGFDIFVTAKDSAGKFSVPAPLPYPINTTGDDECYVTSPDNSRAYYASSHEDNAGFGEWDIYMISLSHDGEGKEDPLALLKGQVIPDVGDTLPAGVTVVVNNKMNGDLNGLYRPQRNGNFSVILKPGMLYSFSYQLNGKEFYKDEIDVPVALSYQEIERAIPLNPVKMHVEVKPVLPGNISLDLTVIDIKNNQPLSDASVLVTTDSLHTYELKTGSNGKLDSIPMEENKSYRIVATYNKFKGEPAVFSTVGVKGRKKFAKTIYISTSTETYNPDTLVYGAFIHYFEFNQTEFDAYPNYGLFLKEIDKALAEKDVVTVKITASASHIPTRTTGGVRGLAKMRAEALEKKLSEYISSKGVDLKRVKFQINFSVGGPAYRSDFREHIREFEKFQYAQASVH